MSHTDTTSVTVQSLEVACAGESMAAITNR